MKRGSKQYLCKPAPTIANTGTICSISSVTPLYLVIQKVYVPFMKLACNTCARFTCTCPDSNTQNMYL